ncbi:MAG: TOPRIM nucleotidyl transferase/hydrolase domain-containing protein, partial [bacterium]
LRPLRDAEQALSAGRGSRLAQVLSQSDGIEEGRDKCNHNEPLVQQPLSVLGIGDLINTLLDEQQGVKSAHTRIDNLLTELSLKRETVTSTISVSGAKFPNKILIRQLLEKLDLRLDGPGKLGLGSNNLLFTACELLLFAQEEVGNNLLLIEEPEAHLHAQRQLRVMKFLQEQAGKREERIQVIVTTHSPNLASAIELDNIVMIHGRRAFSMARGKTILEESDYSFLQRFLDVTKANLFFARGVMIVEGDAENILLPTLANLIGRDFTEHGVSIVNVGGVGLHRYARIFQRADGEKLDIPVACVTDMDVMPDCAPEIIGKVKNGNDWPDENKRRWRSKSDFEGQTELDNCRKEKVDKASGQSVKTFVSDEWTLEYDLALGPKDEKGCFSEGLAEDVFVAASLADEDDAINAQKKRHDDVENAACKEFAELKNKAEDKDGCEAQEVLASQIYAKFAKDGVSKAIAAQYLAERLRAKFQNGELSAEDLRKRLPNYLKNAIDYVTGGGNATESAECEKATAHEQSPSV